MPQVSPAANAPSLEGIAKEQWVARCEAERKAARYKELLLEALEQLPGRGNLRRRIIQATGRDDG